LQLATSPPTRGTDGQAVPLNLNPVFTGDRQSIPVLVNGQGDPANSIRFAFNTGFRLTDHFVYQGSGIDGLIDGVTDFVIPSATDPAVFQLADSNADAEAGTALAIGSNAPGGRYGGTLTFDPGISVDTSENTVDLGFNYGLTGTLPTGTPLVYHAALGTTLSGLADGTTYDAIGDSANPRILRLATTTTSAADAQNAYAAGVASYNTDYNLAYTTAHDAYLAANPGDNAGAMSAGTTAANTAAASFGPIWTASGIDGARIGSAAPIGTFPVTVNAIANTINFGFDAGFVRNEPLVYQGPSGTNPGIIGLTPGTLYYVRQLDVQKSPGLIQLAAASGNIVTLGNSAGTMTTVNFGALNTGGVSVASNQITFLNPVADPSDTPTIFDPGFNSGDPFVYEGPVGPGDSGISGLIAGTTYYVVLTATPGVIELSATPGGTSLSLGLGTAATNIEYSTPFTPTGLLPKTWSCLNGNRTTGREPGSDPCENDPDLNRFFFSLLPSPRPWRLGGSIPRGIRSNRDLCRVGTAHLSHSGGSARTAKAGDLVPPRLGHQVIPIGRLRIGGRGSSPPRRGDSEPGTHPNRPDWAGSAAPGGSPIGGSYPHPWWEQASAKTNPRGCR
jgi:hypothetical protein